MGNNNTSGFQDAAEENPNTKVEETRPKSVQEAASIVTDAKDDVGIDGDQIPDGAPEDGQEGRRGHFVDQSDENGGRMLASEETKAEEGAEGQIRDGKVGSEQEEERVESQVQDPMPVAVGSEEAKREYEEERSKDSNPQLNIVREETGECKSDSMEQSESPKLEKAEMLSPGSTVMSNALDEQEHQGSDEVESNLNENQGNSTSTNMEKLESQVDDPLPAGSNKENPEESSKGSNPQLNLLREEMEERRSDLDEQQESHTPVEAEMSIGSPVMPPSHDGLNNHGSDEAELKLNENEGNSTSTIMSPSSNEEDPDSEELDSNLNKDEGSITESRFAPTTDLENNQHLDVRVLEKQHLDVHTSYAHDEAARAENLNNGFSGNELIISLPSEISIKVESEAAVENGTDHHEPDSEQMNYDRSLQSQAEASLMAKHDHSNGDDEERSGNQAGCKSHGEEISLLGVLKPEANLILTSPPPPPEAMEAAEESNVAGNNQDQQSENGSQLHCSFAASKEEKAEVPQLGIPIIDGQNKEPEPAQTHATVEVMMDHTENPRIEIGKEELLQESSPDQEKESVTESEDSPQDISSNSSWEFNTGNSSEFFVDMAPTFIAAQLPDEEEPVPFPIQLPAAVTARKEETKQQLGRLSTDSAPENMTIEMQKSPSFNISLHLRRRSTEDYSDQTPLLRKYQDKNTITYLSKETNKAFEMPNHEEAMSVEEKESQTLEKSDSEKPLIMGWMKEDDNSEVHRHQKASKEEMTKSVPSEAKEKQYSRRRSTIFGSCLCCAATNAIS